MVRYMSIWFPYLLTDRITRSRLELKNTAFVLTAPERGRIVIKAASQEAMKQGINPGMTAADARAILPELKVLDHKEGVEEKLLTRLAEWCLRFTPIAAIDPANSLLLDISGCPHLWGGEPLYLKAIIEKLQGIGFMAKAAIADTIGTAWAVARYARELAIVPPGRQLQALAKLPPAALRLEAGTLERMEKLGFYQIGSFIDMPRSILRRRFGQGLLNRVDQALGQAIEILEPVQPAVVFQKRLPCLEPVRTRTAIDIALQKLLKELSEQLSKESKGLRTATFRCYRIDGIIKEIQIGTNRPVRNAAHLMKLFEQKIDGIAPGLGIELFVLEAPVTEDLSSQQESLWNVLGSNNESSELSDLLDRIAGKLGSDAVRRYLPAEHYLPERSFKVAASLFEKADTAWRDDKPRPILLLPKPERIEVTVPLPDYPPMLFIYKNKRHTIKKADGPERIEQEWWLEKGLVRDYYVVEDEEGARYWLFRLGRYEHHTPEWFIHGFFA